MLILQRIITKRWLLLAATKTEQIVMLTTMQSSKRRKMLKVATVICKGQLRKKVASTAKLSDRLYLIPLTIWRKGPSEEQASKAGKTETGTAKGTTQTLI